jgi:periplasmic protein TonB
MNPSLPPDRDPRRTVGKLGAPSLALAWGWSSLAGSVLLHGVILLALAVSWELWGQGNEGTEGQHSEDSEAAASSDMQLIAPQPSEAVSLKPRTSRTFQPTRSRVLVAATALSEIQIPDWEMAPIQPFAAPPAAAKATPSKDKGTASHSTQKARESGARGGTGKGLLAVDLPKILRKIAPPYPAAATAARAEGIATVKVTIGTEGQVLGCSIHRSAGHRALDQSALRAVRDWQFTPARDNRTGVLVRVAFRLS